MIFYFVWKYKIDTHFSQTRWDPPHWKKPARKSSPVPVEKKYLEIFVSGEKKQNIEETQILERHPFAQNGSSSKSIRDERSKRRF